VLPYEPSTSSSAADGELKRVTIDDKLKDGHMPLRYALEVPFARAQRIRCG